LLWNISSPDTVISLSSVQLDDYVSSTIQFTFKVVIFTDLTKNAYTHIQITDNVLSDMLID